INLSSSVTAPDPNEQFTAYQWTVTTTTTGSGGTPSVVVIASGTGPRISFPAPTGGSDSVTLTVTDADGGTRAAHTAIVVVPAGQALNLTPADFASTSQVNVLASGNDTISAGGAPAGSTVVLTAIGGGNTLIGGPGINYLYGDSGSNLLE